MAVDGISFQVAPGEIVGLVGPNGAGKTTTIDMILGVLSPTSGAIRIDGLDLARRRCEALQRTNFAAVYAPLPGNLSVSQNLRVFGLMYGLRDVTARVEELLAEFDLVPFRGVKTGVLSSGEQTRVSLAKALLNRPRLLLLDEPTASLDPSVARDLRARLRGVAAREGQGVLWTSHNMREVEEVCDRVLFLSRGRILLQGWMQAVSWLLAPSYVFEAMRALAAGRAVSWPALGWAALLAVGVNVLSGWVFARVHRHAVRTGLIARYSAETVS